MSDDKRIGPWLGVLVGEAGPPLPAQGTGNHLRQVPDHGWVNPHLIQISDPEMEESSCPRLLRGKMKTWESGAPSATDLDTTLQRGETNVSRKRRGFLVFSTSLPSHRAAAAIAMIFCSFVKGAKFKTKQETPPLPPKLCDCHMQLED